MCLVEVVQAIYQRLHLEDCVPQHILEKNRRVTLYSLKILYYAGRGSGKKGGSAAEDGGGEALGGIKWHRDTVRFLMRMIASFVVLTRKSGGGGSDHSMVEGEEQEGGAGAADQMMGVLAVGEAEGEGAAEDATADWDYKQEVAPLMYRALGLEAQVQKQYNRRNASVILGSLQGKRKGWTGTEHGVTNTGLASMSQLIGDFGLASHDLSHLSLELQWIDRERFGKFKHQPDAPLLSMPSDLRGVDRPTMLSRLMRTVGKLALPPV